MLGYDKGRFSFNVKGGRCEACQGDGILRISMHFLPDVYVPCDQCGGKRYNEETLQVHYKGKTIADVLDMTVEEALEFFGNVSKIKHKLQTLNDVGLSYIKLGQSATTLSGGEAQRVKLASELQKKATGKTLFVLDENGVGQVVLASGYSATYCKEDGLQLDKNVISISLNLEISSTNSEIHDFNITVTQEENQGKVNTVYSSQENIRSKVANPAEPVNGK